jgi:hypothetical protein
MKIQQGAYPVQRRSTLQANPQYAGHNAGIHPEDQPFLSTDLEEDESYYETRPPTSTRRYQTGTEQIIERGNKRIIIHNQPPPRRHLHWSLILGLGMLLTIGLWVGGSFVISWWNNHQLDSVYGMPRTFQTDQVVGHDDSADHPTHFIAVNLNSRITVIEIPGGDSAHARIYAGPTLFSDNGSSIPVTLAFSDVNGDGKIDMVVHIGDQRIVYVNDGTQFKVQP